MVVWGRGNSSWSSLVQTEASARWAAYRCPGAETAGSAFKRRSDPRPLRRRLLTEPHLRFIDGSRFHLLAHFDEIDRLESVNAPEGLIEDRHHVDDDADEERQHASENEVSRAI